jgi:hypothetical protein
VRVRERSRTTQALSLFAPSTPPGGSSLAGVNIAILNPHKIIIKIRRERALSNLKMRGPFGHTNL